MKYTVTSIFKKLFIFWAKPLQLFQKALAMFKIGV